MKSYIVLLLFAVIVSTPVIQQSFVDYLKKKVKWRVADPSENKFRDWTKEEIKELMNTKSSKRHHEKHHTSKINMLKKPNLDDFDFRMFFPECCPAPRDVLNCGGSWSFATVIPLQQRYCAYYGSKAILSVQDPLSCSTENEGCKGGYLEEAWSYFENVGVVEEDCFPFTAGEGDVEACIDKCKNGAEWKKYKAADTYPFWTQDEIMEDLTNYGPISTSMEVYEDFLSYFGGMDPYKYEAGDYLGTIGVIILGYGYDFDDNYYWICQNNWGTEWGDQGYFKIYFGECRIDKMTYAGMPNLITRKK